MEENTQKKLDFIALVGRPDVGKSTLMNHLVGQKITITSNRPQTIRNRMQTAYTDGRGQIVLLDTPGTHKVKNKLGEYMVNVAEHTLENVNTVLWLVEPTTFIGTGERHIAEQLNKTKTPVILVINKTDAIKQQDGILIFMAAYRDVCRFAEIAPPSALGNKNTDLLTELVFEYLPYGPQFYNEDTMTDQPMRQIASKLIREKTLRLLSDKIPHDTAVTIERTKKRLGDIIDIDANIVRERGSHRGTIIDKDGSTLKCIETGVRKSIEHMMDTWVNPQLWTRVRKEWRDNDLYIKNYGYDGKNV